MKKGSRKCAYCKRKVVQYESNPTSNLKDIGISSTLTCTENYGGTRNLYKDGSMYAMNVPVCKECAKLIDGGKI